MFRIKSRNGRSADVLRSAVQKMIRRGRREDAMLVAAEIFDTAVAAGEHALITNLVNRLKVIAMEDVGVASPLTIISVGELLLSWDNWRALPLKRRGGYPADIRHRILAAVAVLATAPKLRLVSHARAVFMERPPLNSAARYLGVFSDPGGKGPTLTCPAIRPGDLEADGGAFVARAGEFYSRLVSRRDDALVLIPDFRGGVDPGGRASKEFGKGRAAILWDIIMTLRGGLVMTIHEATVNFAVATLFRWYRGLSLKEREAFLVCAVLLHARGGHSWPDVAAAFHGGKLSYLDGRVELHGAVYDVVSSVEVAAVFERVAASVRGDIAPVAIPDYCVDVHTAEGRAAGKNTAVFVREGAWVENMYKPLYVPGYEAVYLELRTGLGTEAFELEVVAAPPPAESEIFDDVLRAQLVTSRSKTDVYFATRRADSARVVVKGPFDSRDAPSLEVLMLDSVKRLLPGMDPVGLDLIEAHVDLFEDTPLGFRVGAQGSLARFLVAPDLFHTTGGWVTPDPDAPAVVGGQLPRRIASSKLWPATLVYDHDDDVWKIGTYPFFEGRSHRSDGPLILAICFRHIFGVPDSCRRNFIVHPESGHVFSLDETGFARPSAAARARPVDQLHGIPASAGGWFARTAARVWPGVADRLQKWGPILDDIWGDDAPEFLAFVRPRLDAVLAGGPAAAFGPAA